MIVSQADYQVLKKHYTFCHDDNKKNPTNINTKTAKSPSSSWQGRMVAHYHSHLYKEYVLADLTSHPTQIGLRWRAKHEVESGKGQKTCGNKHCPSHLRPPNQQTSSNMSDSATGTNHSGDAHISADTKHMAKNPSLEAKRQQQVSHGVGLADYEVPFTYQEHGTTKQELVKLRLCLRCAPLLFEKQQRQQQNQEGLSASTDSRRRLDSCSPSSSSSSKNEDLSMLDKESNGTRGKKRKRASNYEERKRKHKHNRSRDKKKKRSRDKKYR